MRGVFRHLPILSALSLGSTICATKKKQQVYMWGNGEYQARPDAILQFKNFTPKLITNLPGNLRTIEFGEYYDAGIDKDGRLYIWNKKVIDSNADPENRDSLREGIVTLEKSGIKDVKFTQGYIWAVTDNSNKVYQWPIIKEFDTEGRVLNTKVGNRREVDPLKGTTQIATGNDHLIAMNGKGQVHAMGDDTLGQCGQCDTDRHTHPPFTERRVKFPSKVNNIPEIRKVVAGGMHSLVLDATGNLYGWGSNSTVQLSHEEEHSAMNKPLLCSYSPIKISKGLDNGEIIDVVAGQEFTVVVTKNRNTGSCEVFSFGNNLRGELGISEMRHLKDVSRIEALSNYAMKVQGEQRKVTIESLKCGDRHCIALLNIGYLMEWGDNERGQMGNQKRSSVMAPVIMRDFIGKNVTSVFAGKDCSAVIVESDE